VTDRTPTQQVHFVLHTEIRADVPALPEWLIVLSFTPWL
jgi:hypothetical protein